MYKSRYLEKVRAKLKEPASVEVPIKANEAVLEALASHVPNAYQRELDRYSISSAVMTTASPYFSSSVFQYPRR